MAFVKVESVEADLEYIVVRDVTIGNHNGTHRRFALDYLDVFASSIASTGPTAPRSWFRFRKWKFVKCFLRGAGSAGAAASARPCFSGSAEEAASAVGVATARRTLVVEAAEVNAVRHAHQRGREETIRDTSRLDNDPSRAERGRLTTSFV